jgi:hypothetical protein
MIHCTYRATIIPSAFHAGNTGSNPVGDARYTKAVHLKPPGTNVPGGFLVAALVLAFTLYRSTYQPKPISITPLRNHRSFPPRPIMATPPSIPGRSSGKGHQRFFTDPKEKDKRIMDMLGKQGHCPGHGVSPSAQMMEDACSRSLVDTTPKSGA